MVIRLMKRIDNPHIQQGILDLLTLCSNEFIPPLTARNSTTQSQLDGVDSGGAKVPYAYFENIRVQPAFVILENGKVVGFMSFKRNYVSPEIPPEMTPNLYITTVIVHPNYRHKGFTNQLYTALLNRFNHCHIFTRTWSTNVNHTRILISRKFYEYVRLENDRGEGIDTVYYHHPPMSQSKLDIIRQYRLTGNFFFLSLLVVLTAAFLVAWLMTPDGILHELYIAFSTSLIASVLCLLSDSILKYRESRNDEYILTLKSFGIENLQFHKDQLLEAIIPKCSEEIWISGYRLIMTSKASFLEALTAACKKHRGISVRVLAVAPWSRTFELVYGTEDVSDNYLRVLGTLCKCVEDYGCRLEVRLTEKPIFNDTYKVDDRFVTGPYLHCLDKNKRKITAKDFFSLDITDPRRDLYEIIGKDYLSVWDSAPWRLDNALFYRAYRQVEYAITKRSREEKLDFLQRCCGDIPAPAEAQPA